MGFEAWSPSPRALKFLGGNYEQEIKLSHVTLTKLLCTCQEVRLREGERFAQSHTAKWWPEWVTIQTVKVPLAHGKASVGVSLAWFMCGGDPCLTHSGASLHKRVNLDEGL